MARLADSLAALTDDEGTLRIDAPAAWSQGRTLYGGMTAALCYRAARPLCDAPLRSAQFLFVGPASGALSLQAEVLRVGKSSCLVAATCDSEAGPAARAHFAFGADRDSRVDLPATTLAVRLPAPADCPAFIGPTGGFHDNFDLRLADGAPLVSGGESRFAVWVRYRDPPGTDAMTALIALADALPPAAMASFPAPGPISTVSWGFELATLPGSIDGWFLLEAASEHSRGGHSMQAMRLWDADGTLVLAGRQLVAIFV